MFQELVLVMFLMDNPLEFTPTNEMEMHAMSKKFNKIHVFNLKWQQQQ